MTRQLRNEQINALATTTKAGTVTPANFIRTSGQPADAKESGAIDNDSTDNLAALQTAAGASTEVQYSGGTYKVSSTGTVGTAANVHIFTGGVLHITGAVVLRGQIQAPRQKIFNFTDGGTLSLPDVANVDLTWGTVGDGVTDDTAGAQAMIGATADGCTLSVPPRSHLVTGGLVAAKQINIRGSGPASIFQVAASVGAGVDILTLAPAATVVLDGLVWKDFAILPASGTPGRHGIVVDTTADASGVARSHFERITVYQLGGNGIKTINLPAKADGWFTSSIDECVLQGGINLVNSGDSITIRKNVCVGAGWGLEIQSVHLMDRPDSIKTSIATSASPQTYTGGALNGVIGSTIMDPGQHATVTTTAHAATYNTGSPIVVNGTDASNNPLTDNLTLTMAGGGETIVGTQHFKAITSIVVPAQSGTSGAFTFGTSPDFPSYASVVDVSDNNITSLGGSVLVHSGDQVNLRNNNSEQFGTALGTGAIDLLGDWGALRAPSVEDSLVNSGNAANVINVDNCLWAKIARNTFGRSVGGLVGINVTANAQNTILEENLPGSVEDYDSDFIHDAGLNTSVWGKYAVGVGGFDGTSVGQPSAGNAATMQANLGTGHDGTIAIEVSENVTTQSFVWSPKTSDVQTNDIIITSQGAYSGATVTNRDSGAIVFEAPAPASGGVCRPWAIILDSHTRFQVGDSGAALSSQPGQTTVLGDIDNGDEIQISHASGMVLQGQAGVVSGVQSFSTLGPQGEVALTTDVTFAPSAVFFDMLTASITTVAGSLEIDFRVCGTVTDGTVGFRLVIDGTPIASATGNIQAVGFSQSTSVLRHVSVTAGTHSVKVQYIAPAGSLNVSAATGNESASLFVRQS